MKKRWLLLIPFLGLIFSSCSFSGESQNGQPLTVKEAANQVSQAAQKYDSSVSADDLLEDIVNLDSSITEEKQCTFSHFFLLLESAFSNTLPEKTGARLMECYENEEDASYSNYDEDSPYTSAFRMASNAGLVNARYFDEDFEPNTLIYDTDVWKILDRFHRYYGTSAVDDFYSYANYDQRIINCEDEGKTASDMVSVSNLIPRDNINTWVKNELVNDEDSNIFYSLFLDSLNDNSGLMAIRTYLDQLLTSENVVTLVDNMVDLHNRYGYGSLYYSLSWGFETVNDESVYAPTAGVFSTDDTVEESAVGGEAYNRTVENFAKRFSILFGSENEGQKYAEYYANFKHLIAKSYRDNSELENERFVVGDDLTFGDSGITVKKTLSEIGFGEDHYWIFESRREAASFYDIFLDENIDALKGYCVFDAMRHYLLLMPENEIINQWVLGTSFEGNRYENSSYFNQYILPYFANDLVNYYSGTEEYKADLEVVVDLYDDLRKTLVEKAKSSSWLSADGASKVAQKADNMKYFIGNSSSGSEKNPLLQTAYSGLSSPSLMGCVILYEKTLWENRIERMDNPPTNDFYFDAMDYFPFTANAYYMPGRNGIFVTMGYMTANKRPSLMSQEEILSRYGWVMGHEIGHGFDTGGFKYDYAGRYNEGWMSDSDREGMSDFADKYTAYLEGYEGYIGFSTSGKTVLNEAIADNIGISLSLTIGKKNGFSTKTFFDEGGKAFGGYMSRAYFTTNEYYNDAHPYARCRVNKVFSCFDDFHNEYSTKEGDHMYVPEEERLVLY